MEKLIEGGEAAHWWGVRGRRKYSGKLATNLQILY